MLRTKRKVLQMNCLSSGDLKEEKNCSLRLNPTLNIQACPILQAAQVSHSRVVFRWHRPAEGAPFLVLFESWVPRPPIPWSLRRRVFASSLQKFPFVDPSRSCLPIRH